MINKSLFVAFLCIACVAAQPWWHQSVYKDVTQGQCTDFNIWRTWNNGTCQQVGSSVSYFFYCVGNTAYYLLYADSTTCAGANPTEVATQPDTCTYVANANSNFKFFCDNTQSAAGSAPTVANINFADDHCGAAQYPITENPSGACTINNGASTRTTCNSDGTVLVEQWETNTACSGVANYTNTYSIDTCIVNGPSSVTWKCYNVPQAPRAAPMGSGNAPQASGNAPQASGNAPQASGNAPQASGNAPQASGNAPQASGNAPQASGNAPQAAATPKAASAPGTAAPKGFASAVQVSTALIACAVFVIAALL